MIRFQQTCWEVYESYDRDITHIAYASTKSVADQIRKSNNDYYREVVEKTFDIIIVESLDEIERLKKETLIASAKAKLSKAELEALGIS